MNWKRYLLPSALILALGLTVGIAQNINKALQLSQDPTGAIGVDANNNIYFPGHFLTQASAPTLSSCGTTPTIAGSDSWATIVTGTTTTACTVTFRQAFLAAPFCVLAAPGTSVVPFTYTTQTTSIIVTFTGTNSALRVNYFCPSTT